MCNRLPGGKEAEVTQASGEEGRGEGSLSQTLRDGVREALAQGHKVWGSASVFYMAVDSSVLGSASGLKNKA